MPDNLPAIDARTVRWLPWLVATSFFMQMLDGTIVNTALPAMARSLGENPLRMQAVVISYLLTMAICIPASGWLTDRLGPRRLMTWSIGLFTLGSLLCAVSNHLYLMVGARIVQGVGGALMVPVGRLVILRLYPKRDLVRVLSIITIPGLFGSLIGPALSGILTQYASWHWIFIINIPVGLAGMAVTMKLMPYFDPVRDHPFDMGGFLLFGLSLVFISLSLEVLGLPNARGSLAFVLAALGLAVQAVYWLGLSRRPEALFSPSIFQINTFSVGLAANLFTRIGSGAIPFLVPLLLQVAMGYSPLLAGLLMMPIAIASVVAKLLARPLASHFKFRSILIINTFLQGGLIAGLALTPMTMNPVVFCLHLAALGGINSLQFSFLNTYTLMDLPYEDSGSGNALMSVMTQLSQSLAVSLAATLLFAFQSRNGAAAGVEPSAILTAFRYTFMVVGAGSLFSGLIFYFGPQK